MAMVLQGIAIIGGVLGVFAFVRQRRADGRSTERGDIRWKSEIAGDGNTWLMRNVGLDVAHAVVLVAQIDGVKRTVSVRKVKPGSAVTVDLTDIRERHAAKHQADSESFGEQLPHCPHCTTVVVSGQVFARTTLGTPKTQTLPQRAYALALLDIGSVERR